MADISQDLQKILDAIYGEEVRGSIYHAISLINDVSEVVLTTGTAVTSASSSSTGFFTDSLYLNTDTYELWKCVGTDMWQSLGILKGATGNGIDNIEKTASVGLVDTYTITYTDSTTDKFDITNGEDGANGNKWYRGTGISGKAALPTVYANSGVADANSGDMFLNPSEGAVYSCVTGGIPSVATWQYEMTLSGGSGGTSDYPDLNNKPQINGHTLVGNQTGADLGLASSTDIPTVDQTYSATSSNAQSGKAVAQAIGALDKSDSAVSGQYVSAVSETDGIITVSRENLPTIPTVDQTYSASSTNAQSGTAVAGAISGKANTSQLDEWSAERTLSAGDTSKTFTGMNTSYGYRAFVQVADGETPPTLTSMVTSGTSITVTFSEVTSAQAAGNAAKIKLRIIK